MMQQRHGLLSSTDNDAICPYSHKAINHASYGKRRHLKSVAYIVKIIILQKPFMYLLKVTFVLYNDERIQIMKSETYRHFYIL